MRSGRAGAPARAVHASHEVRRSEVESLPLGADCDNWEVAQRRIWQTSSAMNPRPESADVRVISPAPIATISPAIIETLSSRRMGVTLPPEVGPVQC